MNDHARPRRAHGDPSAEDDAAVHAAELREDIRERSDPLPEPAREELFGLEELGPTIVLDMIGRPTTFRGLDGTEQERALKRQLNEAADKIRKNPDEVARTLDAKLMRARGVVGSDED